MGGEEHQEGSCTGCHSFLSVSTLSDDIHLLYFFCKARVANAPGCLVAYRMDNGYADEKVGFVPRMWHVLAGIFLIGFLHMIFNANPVWTSELLKQDEDAKKSK